MSDAKKNHRLEDILMYQDNALDEAERAELEEHMRGCPECQATLETVKRFLPALQKALVPDEPSPEELLAWAKAQMREKERARDALPAGFFTRMRVALVGFGLAAASAAAIAVRTLLGSGASPVVAHSDEDAGQADVMVSSPHPPRPPAPDGGPDGGAREPLWRESEGK